MLSAHTFRRTIIDHQMIQKSLPISRKKMIVKMEKDIAKQRKPQPHHTAPSFEMKCTGVSGEDESALPRVTAVRRTKKVSLHKKRYSTPKARGFGAKNCHVICESAATTTTP